MCRAMHFVRSFKTVEMRISIRMQASEKYLAFYGLLAKEVPLSNFKMFSCPLEVRATENGMSGS